MRIDPGQKITIGSNLPKCVLLIQNYGPGKMWVNPGYGGPLELMPERFRAVSVSYDPIDVWNDNDKPSQIEVALMVAYK